MATPYRVTSKGFKWKWTKGKYWPGRFQSERTSIKKKILAYFILPIAFWFLFPIVVLFLASWFHINLHPFLFFIPWDNQFEIFSPCSDHHWMIYVYMLLLQRNWSAHAHFRFGWPAAVRTDAAEGAAALWVWGHGGEDTVRGTCRHTTAGSD